MEPILMMMVTSLTELHIRRCEFGEYCKETTRPSSTSASPLNLSKTMIHKDPKPNLSFHNRIDLDSK